MSTAQRVCAFSGCGGVLVPRRGEGTWHFDRRQYCGKPCAGKARRQPINHGTPSGAQQHRLRGEELCDDCKKAERQYQRDYAEANPALVDRKRAVRAAQSRARSLLASRHQAEYLALLTREKEKAGIT